jgi:hypothetical protein
MQILFRHYQATLMLALALFITAGAGFAADDQRSAIDWLLDDFHQAAADADRDRYLGHFAPDGVFMGTDDWERWPLAEFIPYVEQRFADVAEINREGFRERTSRNQD